METGNSWIGGRDARNSAHAERVRAARARRLRDKNKCCVLPDRLLHRVSVERCVPVDKEESDGDAARLEAIVRDASVHTMCLVHVICSFP